MDFEEDQLTFCKLWKESPLRRPGLAAPYFWFIPAAFID